MHSNSKRVLFHLTSIIRVTKKARPVFECISVYITTREWFIVFRGNFYLEFMSAFIEPRRICARIQVERNSFILIVFDDEICSAMK